LRLGEGRVGPKHHFLAQLLLPLDLRQQHVFPAIGTVHITGPQLGGQTVALAAEQQERVIAGRLEVTVVRAVLLLAVHRDLGRVHVQHNALRGIDRLGFGDQLPIHRRQPGEILFLGKQVGLE
jgi:hypothetical protein